MMTVVGLAVCPLAMLSWLVHPHYQVGSVQENDIRITIFI